MENMKTRKDINIRIYEIGICIAIITFVGYVLIEKIHINIYSFVPECYFHKYTGYFCFGCGSTRAIRALFRGDIIKSLYYNADIEYIFFLYATYMISYTFYIVTKGKIHAMRIKPLYGYIIIVLSIVQCLFKNLMAGCFGIWLL